MTREYYPNPGRQKAVFDRRLSAAMAPLRHVDNIRPLHPTPADPAPFDWEEDADVAQLLPTFSTDLEASVVIAEINRCGSVEAKRIVAEWGQRVRSQRSHPSVYVEPDPCGPIERPES